MKEKLDVSIGPRTDDFASLGKDGKPIMDVSLDIKGLGPCPVEPITHIVPDKQTTLALGSATLA
jgi:hypothetical protein